MNYIVMPKMSDTMQEGKVLRWLKKEGDAVKEGEPVAEIETDKADMEVEAFDSGVLHTVLVQEGETVPVGQPIAALLADGEAVPAEVIVPAQEQVPVPPMPETLRPAPAAEEPPPAKPAAPRPSRPTASPLARRMAAAKGIDLSQLTGTGPGGRIIRQDIEAYLGAAPLPAPPVPPAIPTPPPRTEPAPPAPLADRRLPLSSMRKTIARRTTESKQNVPHFYVAAEIDMTEALQLRQGINAAEQEVKVTVNDLVIKAATLALTRAPEVNVTFTPEGLEFKGTINIGFAVALDDGLTIPVIKDCQARTLLEIAREAHDLAERARARSLDPAEFSGATFSVSNLGMYQVSEFIAVINPPEAAILAVGTTVARPVVRDGQVVVRQMMNATLSCDHRALDGATAARFLEALKQVLENPVSLVL